MKLVRGISEAKEALSSARSLDLLNVPPHVQATTQRVFGEPLTPPETVRRIIEMVRSDGDEALRRLATDLESASLDALEVSRTEIQDCYDKVDARVIEALELSAERVEGYHRATKRQTWMDFEEGYGAIVTPLASVGAYVPGGSAPPAVDGDHDGGSCQSCRCARVTAMHATRRFGLPQPGDHGGRQHRRGGQGIQDRGLRRLSRPWPTAPRPFRGWTWSADPETCS